MQTRSLKAKRSVHHIITLPPSFLLLKTHLLYRGKYSSMLHLTSKERGGGEVKAGGGERGDIDEGGG